RGVVSAEAEDGLRRHRTRPQISRVFQDIFRRQLLKRTAPLPAAKNKRLFRASLNGFYIVILKALWLYSAFCDYTLNEPWRSSRNHRYTRSEDDRPCDLSIDGGWAFSSGRPQLSPTNSNVAACAVRPP